MADNAWLRLDPEAARVVINRVHDIADDMHERGEQLAQRGSVASMLAVDASGAAAAKLAAELDAAAGSRMRALGSSLRKQAAATQQSIQAVVGQDQENASILSVNRAEE